MFGTIVCLYILTGYIYACFNYDRCHKWDKNFWELYCMLLWPINVFNKLLKKFKK